MILKKIAAVKGAGRKQFFGLDNLLALIFIIAAITYSLANSQYMFAYFCMGLVVVRVGEIIFELKTNMFDKPFFHYLIGIGIPLQIAWNELR
ncbi:hypothetical protein pETSU_170 [Edwardsiella phage pEt-SU]|uniref:Uncharacterized protein n=1 Tax=Edwardsiella phage pEt-SU TaxID=2562142 RepID=A0A4D6DWM0_9CAUD|nr:hypothetical protein HOV39_gp170 [Edwardsiella phage pEt-SU]QBZ70751.1 hypothetical protein pETSU_170 [Edwardsiella phage pEt-SU]